MAAPLLVVNGPIRTAIGMNSGCNVFGSGNRANATIGRAIRLIIMNVFEMVPGLSDLSTQGHPGKYSFCIAERADANPWRGLNEELGYPDGVSSVTVYAGGGFVNVENHGGATPEAVLDTVADAMASYGCISLGQSVVVLSPEHAKIVASTGLCSRSMMLRHASWSPAWALATMAWLISIKVREDSSWRRVIGSWPAKVPNAPANPGLPATYRTGSDPRRRRFPPRPRSPGRRPPESSRRPGPGPRRRDPPGTSP